MAIIPFDDRDGVIWFNGKIIPWRDAKVHVLTHGLHYGSSVFEGERAYNGKIFKSKEHTERFRKSANIMDFDLPFTDEEINKAKDEVVARMGGGDQYVRPVAFRGSDAGVSREKLWIAATQSIHQGVRVQPDRRGDRTQALRLRQWRSGPPGKQPIEGCLQSVPFAFEHDQFAAHAGRFDLGANHVLLRCDSAFVTRQRYSLQDVADAGLIGGLGPQRDIYLPYPQRPNNGVTFALRVAGAGPPPTAAAPKTSRQPSPVSPPRWSGWHGSKRNSKWKCWPPSRPMPCACCTRAACNWRWCSSAPAWTGARAFRKWAAKRWWP